MINNNFKDLLEKTQEDFIGYGNPNAKILIIGKECAIDPESDIDNIYELSVKKNKEQWLSIINGSGQLNPDNIPSWFTPHLNYEEKFSPLFPFKGQLFTIRRNKGNGGNGKDNKGTSTTWYNYQKLINRIGIAGRANNSCRARTKDDELDFFKDCFITEFSAECSLYSKKSDKVEGSIKSRTRHLLNEPFFKSFSIIIVACGHYIRRYGDIIDLQKLYEVKYEQPTVDVNSNNWYNFHKGNNKILIHTNQLSMNISDELLNKIARVIGDFDPSLAK